MLSGDGDKRVIGAQQLLRIACELHTIPLQSKSFLLFLVPPLPLPTLPRGLFHSSLLPFVLFQS